MPSVFEPAAEAAGDLAEVADRTPQRSAPICEAIVRGAHGSAFALFVCRTGHRDPPGSIAAPPPGMFEPPADASGERGEL
jgi:hypothetical protein